MGLAAYTVAVGLLNRDAAADRRRGLELMMQTRDIWLRKRAHFLIPVTDMWAARETSRRGDRDAAIPVMRRAASELRRAGHLFYSVWATDVLIQTLLERGVEDDQAEAREAIDWLTKLANEHESAMLEIMLLRLRALLCRVAGNQGAYRDLAGRYRAMAIELGFEGHLDWANAMP
jgi:ATP/maltotriose-dependent transcriptional regulator MalT